MPALFLALIATLLASTGGRDQRLVAHLSWRLGGSCSLLVTACLVAAATAALAAVAGEGLAALMPPAAKSMLVAIALLLAAGELAWPFGRREADEPTRSFFAIAAVLASRQISDGARFLIVAIAAANGAPWLAGIGGALGSCAALAVGWALGSTLAESLPLRAIRLVLAALLAVAGIATGLAARGIL